MSFGSSAITAISATGVKRMGMAVALILGMASVAHAQASRTWVSGVGDDANPCSRTAPCKTFAGAIAKTAPAGFIDVLDPGGFGAVTVTKSITIDGGGNLAGVLVAGTNGIVISGAGIVVTLRNLSLESSAGNQGINGIDVIQAAEVHIERCIINGFSNSAILLNNQATPIATISDTTIVDNTNAGIAVWSGRVSISNLHAYSNANGVVVVGPAVVTVRDSHAFGNAVGFASIVNPAAVLTCERCTTTNNQFGVIVNSGATIRLSDSVVSGNSNSGLCTDGASFIVSLQGNTVAGNVTDGTFTSTVIKQ